MGEISHLFLYIALHSATLCYSNYKSMRDESSATEVL